MSTVSRASEGDDAPDLLPWLARVTDDPALESRVALRHLGDARGRCLVALRNLTPDEVIFNVPFSLVFAEREDDARDDEDHLPWSACMAVRLLEERAAKGPLLPWIQSLPSRVSTAPLEYDDASLEACHDPAVIAEARDVATAHARAAERLARASRRRRRRRRRLTVGRGRAPQPVFHPRPARHPPRRARRRHV